MRENFRHNCIKLTIFVFVKSIKRCFQRGSFNDKHVNLSLLKDLYPFLEFKNLVFGPEKKRNTDCKNALIIALDDL